MPENQVFQTLLSGPFRPNTPKTGHNSTNPETKLQKKISPVPLENGFNAKPPKGRRENAKWNENGGVVNGQSFRDDQTFGEISTALR
jgi:hypothetical protein